jgi:hypothetical protein
MIFFLVLFCALVFAIVAISGLSISGPNQQICPGYLGITYDSNVGDFVFSSDGKSVSFVGPDKSSTFDVFFIQSLPITITLQNDIAAIIVNFSGKTIYVNGGSIAEFFAVETFVGTTINFAVPTTFVNNLDNGVFSSLISSSDDDVQVTFTDVVQTTVQT